MKLPTNTLLAVIAAISQSCMLPMVQYGPGPEIPPPPCMTGDGRGPIFNNGPQFVGPSMQFYTPDYRFDGGPQFINGPQPFFDGGDCGVDYGPAIPAWPGQYGSGPQSFVPGSVRDKYGQGSRSTAVWGRPQH